MQSKARGRQHPPSPPCRNQGEGDVRSTSSLRFDFFARGGGQAGARTRVAHLDECLARRAHRDLGGSASARKSCARGGRQTGSEETVGPGQRLDRDGVRRFSLVPVFVTFVPTRE